MKSVMKKLFSLLLVGVVTVSMFGFVAPPVEAAEANKWVRVTDKTIIRSFVKPIREIEVKTRTPASYRTFKVGPPKGSRFSNQCSFKTKHPVIYIEITFFYYDPSNPEITRLFYAEFEKLVYENSSGEPVYKDTVRDPDKSIFIEIDKNAKVTASTFNGWQLISFSNDVLAGFDVYDEFKS